MRTLQRFMDGFINRATTGYFKIGRKDIRAIVLFGEASPPAFTALGTMAVNVIGTDTVHIAPGIAPPDVLTYGAAWYARKAEENKDEQSSF
jgi:hypothetical protein